MLLNNVKADFKKVLVEENTTQKELAERLGSKPQYISQIINRSPVDGKLISLFDALGYDVELKVIKKA